MNEFGEFTWQEPPALQGARPLNWRCREWRVGVRVSKNGVTDQIVHCFPETDMPPSSVTNWPNSKSTKVAIALARALNYLEQFRWSVYGAQVSD